MLQIAIVADDLTGAADTGACFADAGLATVIPLSYGTRVMNVASPRSALTPQPPSSAPSPVGDGRGGLAASVGRSHIHHPHSVSGSTIPNADVVVLSTESRDLTAAVAAEAVHSAIVGITGSPGDPGPRWVYKKIDSALRGHPRDELLALMTAIGATRTVVAPAFPAEGRTTIGGRQHIDGVPLESSRFGAAGAVSDLVALFQTSHGPPVHLLDLAMLRGQPDAMQRLLDDGPDGIIVADAETDEDLLALARAVNCSDSRLRLLCGTAGFARHLARALPLTPIAPRPPETVRGAGPVLIVAGSQHEATARQVQTLREAGVPIVRPAQSLIDDPAAPLDATVAEVAAHLAAGQSAVLTTVGLAPCPRGGHTVAARLAQIVAAPEVSGRVGGLVLTGGDVAAAVCAALHASALWLGGEISPGLPWGVLAGGRLHAIPVVTKAGSFGGNNALLSCVSDIMANTDGG